MNIAGSVWQVLSNSDNWTNIISVLTVLAGLLGIQKKVASNASMKEAIEKWSNVAGDFVVALITHGIVTDPDGIIKEWETRFRQLMKLAGYDVTDDAVSLGRANVVAKLGTASLDVNLAKMAVAAQGVARAFNGAGTSH